MKLLHLCPTLDPQAGGTVTAIRHLVEMAPGDQEILTLDPPNAPFLRPLSCRCTGVGHVGGKYSFSPALVPYLKEHSPKYGGVVVHGTWQYHGLGAWEALRHTKIPYALFPHGMLDPWFRRAYPLKHLKKVIYWHTREKFVLRDAAIVVFTSSEEQAGAHASFTFPKCREIIMPLGIQNPYSKEEIEPAPVEQRLLFLGRLDIKKGCDLLLRAFALVMRNTAWKLTMAGPDSSGWSKYLIGLAEELGISSQVEWPGMLVGKAKWSAIQKAQALVLPSHQENFGLVVVEALACGTPVLLSRQVNIWREVIASEAGLAAEDTLDGTVQLLSQWKALCQVTKSEMRLRARSCFESNFDIKNTFPTFLSILQQYFIS